MDSQTPSPLMSLPAELRMKILEFVLIISRPISPKYFSILGRFLVRPLNACRQLRNEDLNTLYTSHTFVFLAERNQLKPPPLSVCAKMHHNEFKFTAENSTTMAGFELFKANNFGALRSVKLIQQFPPDGRATIMNLTGREGNLALTGAELADRQEGLHNVAKYLGQAGFNPAITTIEVVDAAVGESILKVVTKTHEAKAKEATLE
ncbi:hypothetical protein LTS18_006817 [Coniosporium uncinatum]|uniref:Uncharacterized protein n=1 Tax=Coniosporium uncinatum TaxID=93489 RepID=A0ACC3D3L4_9PEZI|nr:hypothetical protein LTS18_006817 [Coniosporium uncinatum]